jgi:hypothetical protein
MKRVGVVCDIHGINEEMFHIHFVRKSEIRMAMERQTFNTEMEIIEQRILVDHCSLLGGMCGSV